MTSNSGLCDALLPWFSSCFDVDLASAHSVSDGANMAKILHKIDASHFSDKWLASIKNVPNENKRLKANNVKKVVHTVNEYYTDVLGMSMAEFPSPDPLRVAEGNIADASRLLQLVLGCAVNCDNKEVYIESIMVMEQSVQQVIMQAIQEIMQVQTSPSDPSLPGMTSSDLRKLMDDLAKSNEEKEELKQKCHDLENQIDLLQDEKMNISVEFEQLQAQQSGSGKNRDDMPGTAQKEWKKKLETLQDDLFKIENQRDELHVKVDLLEKNLEDSQTKEAELQKLADQALKLKDEVDILRETADKATKYEATIESYKKKLEDMGDMKRQLKILEEKNTDYMQRNMDLEEDVKKTGNWRPQVEAYKKQITELHAKLDSESKKSDRLEFETKKLLEKVETLSLEKDRLSTEKEDLKVKHDELQDEIKFGQATSDRDKGGLDQDSGTLEMIPPAIKERLLRLQHENKKLKEAGSNPNAGSKDIEVLQSMIDSMKDRERELEDSNRAANQKILELESKLEEGAASVGSAPRIPGSKEELELKLAEAKKKITGLQETVNKKDVEMQGMEERYKKYIEKAKSVIKTLDPKQGSAGAGGPEVTALRSQINEKDRLIETLEHETEKARAVREMEERLISSAFYNLSMQMHRNAVESRLGQSSSSSGGQQNPGPAGQAQNNPGSSFLARQRVANQNRSRGSGYTSSDFLEY